MSALVTNARSRIAYNVARSLGQKGIAVYAADFVPNSMSFASRYVRDSFVYPSPFRTQDAFLQVLKDEIRRRNVKVLIPVYEETFLIAKHKADFEGLVAMAVPDYTQILIAHNKDRWEPVARSLGIPVPATFSRDELVGGGLPGKDIRFPVLIKPKQGGGSWGIQQADSASELQSLLDQPDWHGKAWDRFFVQEKISGDSHCVAMLFNRGRLRASLGYRQLRDYPATGGQATLRISERCEAAEGHLRTLLEHLSWHGPCQADFIIDRQTKVPYLIDVNPRLWGSLAQAIGSGVDFPYLIYRMALDGDVEAVRDFRIGVVTRWLGGDLAALPSRLKASQSRLALIADFVHPAHRVTLTDDFSIADPLPFGAWAIDTVLRALKFRTVKAVSHDSLEGIWE